MGFVIAICIALACLQGSAAAKGVTGQDEVFRPRASSPGPSSAELIINELAYAWPGEPLEFVELFNRSSSTVELEGLTLSDDRRAPTPVPADQLTLGPGDYVVLVNRKEVFARYFPDVSCIEVPSWPVLNNGADAVVIELRGALLDSVRYEAAWGGAAGSLERRNPHVLLSTPANWGSSTHPSGATPGAANTLLQFDGEPPTLRDAEEDGPHLLWARASEPLDPEHLSTSNFLIDGRQPLDVVLETDLTTFWLSLAAPLAASTIEVVRLRDLAGNESAAHALPIARIPRRGDVVINEIMYDPRMDGTDGLPDQTEYVELMNVGSERLRMRGIQLSERPDETGLAGATPITSTHAYLDPRGFAVAYAVRQPLQTGHVVPLEFGAFGPDAGREALWLGTTTLTPAGLNNSGQLLRLVSSGGELLDEVDYHPDMHSLTLRRISETRGVSLERIDATTPGDIFENWSSSRIAVGGTPGRPNSFTAHDDNFSPTSAGVHPDPSPFSPDDDGHEDVTHLRYQLRNEVSVIRVKIFDLAGRVVRSLTQATYTPGAGSILWDGKDERSMPVPIGIYVILLEGITAETAATERYKSVVAVARTR